MDEYHINHVSSKRVTAISKKRIPFEPKGEYLQFRNELRKNIMSLEPLENEIMMATLEYDSKDFFDVENALFYNIGVSAFKKATQNGLYFRADVVPASSYCYEYRMANKDIVQSNIDQTVCRFNFIMNKITSDTKPVDVWWAFKDGVIETFGEVEGCDFGVSIQVETSIKIVNLASIMKPLLDGVISGLHHCIVVDETVTSKISNRMNAPMNFVKSRLLESENSILGERDLVRTYRAGIKWNPEDERCKEVLLIPTINEKLEQIRITGSVSKFLPRIEEEND